MYAIDIVKSAAKALKAIPKEEAGDLLDKIEALATATFHKKLQGSTNEYRVREGDYRAIYEIDKATMTIRVTVIGHRKEVYRNR